MKLLKSLLLVVAAIFFVQSVNAKAYMKYGKISKEEMEMAVCPFDSNASAVVLGDIGNSSFIITQDRTVITFKRHLRIKVFGKESFDEGDIKIYLYKSLNGIEEKLMGLKGYVYNLEDGKVVKTKLAKSNINKKEVSKNNDLVTVSMPDIKEGSILEIEYSIESPYIFNLQAWWFQTDIPTIYSRYRVGIIEWYNYKNWVEGYLKVNLEEETRSENFSFIKSSSTDLNGQRTSSGTVSFDANVTYKTYTAENVPAFKDEPYITTENDYISSVQFELLSTRFPWGSYKDYTTNWKEINEMLNDSEDFGYTLKNDGHLKSTAELILNQTNDPVEKASMAYGHIKNKMAWDGRYRVEVDNSIRKAYNDNSGNSSDINLNLVALCRRLGLDAYPVIISTRNHGKIRPGLISISQFNHVIAGVKINDNYLLMDAIDQNCPFNMLPPNSLNDKGRLVNEKSGQWVDLYSSRLRSEVYMINAEFDEDFNISGTFSYKGTDYGAYNFRKWYMKEESEEEFIIEFEEDIDNAEITDVAIENIDSLDLPVTLKANVKLTNRANRAGDMVFLTPKVLNQMVENVFKREERTYPVDYNYPFKEQYLINIKLPKGYQVEEVPEQLVLALPNNGGKYIFMVRGMGNTISLTNQFVINQTVFPGNYYVQLKKFYEMIVAKEAEQVVIKKI